MCECRKSQCILNKSDVEATTDNKKKWKESKFYIYFEDLAWLWNAFGRDHFVPDEICHLIFDALVSSYRPFVPTELDMFHCLTSEVNNVPERVKMTDLWNYYGVRCKEVVRLEIPALRQMEHPSPPRFVVTSEDFGKEWSARENMVPLHLFMDREVVRQYNGKVMTLVSDWKEYYNVFVQLLESCV